MCIIAYKSAEAKFPSKKTLRTCFNNNPDGAGFMYNASGVVHIKKGFMSFQQFWKALRAVREEVGDNTSYVMHFRISTQAGMREDCTHPFPLSRHMKDMRLLDTTTSIGVAHNGIISLTSESGWSKTITYSDTMKFITDYLSLIIMGKSWYRDKDKKQLVENLIDNSRLAVLDSTGHCEMLGLGWVENNGVWYSNSSYKPKPKVSITKPYTYTDYSAYKWWSTSWNYDDDDEVTDDISTHDSPIYFDDENEYWEMIEEYYDPNTETYYLDSLDCPATTLGDTCLCKQCASYKACYMKYEETEEDIKNEVYAS